MNIDIECCAVMATDTVADHAKRRLRFVMTRHSERIQRILVKLGDMNPSFGQQGKYCRIRVELVDAPTVVSLDTGPNFEDPIDRAVDRAGRAVLKQLRRTRAVAFSPWAAERFQQQPRDGTDVTQAASDALSYPSNREPPSANCSARRSRPVP